MTETTTRLPRWTDYVPLESLRPAVRNAKLHDVERLANSYAEFGSVESMTVDERTGRLVAGHGRWASLVLARSRGDATPDGVIVDDDGGWLVPIQRGWSSRDDRHAEKYVLASNRLVEIGGGYDDRELAAMLEDLAAEDPDALDLLAYTAEDIEALARLVQDGSDTLDDPDPEPDGGDLDIEDDGEGDDSPAVSDVTVACPACGHHFNPLTEGGGD